jgi:hypothetical protein
VGDVAVSGLFPWRENVKKNLFVGLERDLSICRFRKNCGLPHPTGFAKHNSRRDLDVSLGDLISG